MNVVLKSKTRVITIADLIEGKYQKQPMTTRGKTGKLPHNVKM